MKKTLSILMIGLLSLSFAGEIMPTISLRIGDVLTNGLGTVTPIVGLKLTVGDGSYTGFDTEATSTRLYMEKSFGKAGMGTYTNGHNDEGKAFFTVGTSYGVVDNLNVELEYVINNLAPQTADVLNLSLTVNF
jgi:hypothetical protein